MIPEIFLTKYSSFYNPYRKLFFNENFYVACDFSDLIPSYRMEFSKNFPKELLKQAIEFAENKNYFSFYFVVSSKDYLNHLSNICQSNVNYIIIEEELVLANSKPINILFWDWLFEATNRNEDTYVIQGLLKPEYRKIKKEIL